MATQHAPYRGTGIGGGVVFVKGGACSKCKVGHRGQNNLNAALRHIVLTGVKETTIFSRYPTLLRFVITGDVDF
jgi:hypothetical protein